MLSKRFTAEGSQLSEDEASEAGCLHAPIFLPLRHSTAYRNGRYNFHYILESTTSGATVT